MTLQQQLKHHGEIENFQLHDDRGTTIVYGPSFTKMSLSGA